MIRKTSWPTTATITKGEGEQNGGIALADLCAKNFYFCRCEASEQGARKPISGSGNLLFDFSLMLFLLKLYHKETFYY